MLLPCACISGEEYARCQRELITSQGEVRKLQEQLTARDQTIDLLKAQAAEVREVDPKDYDLLIVPVRVELERQSGGFNADDTPGDDGLILYVQTFDRNNDAIKAAGWIRVTLLDLANPQERMVLGEYTFDARKTRELWYGKMWTHHFTVHCPWFPGQTPAHDEITARVEFTDLLTGRKLTTQAAYKITLPGRDAPTS